MSQPISSDSSVSRKPRASTLVLATVCGLILVTLGMGTPVQAQPRSSQHYFYGGNAVPGELAFQAMLANPHWVAKIQPVKIIVPEGTIVSAWNEGAFAEAAYANPTLGLSIGPVYRFRITNIPRAGSSVIYPSIELMNQLTPPEGLETRFPIKVAFSEEDLRLAAAGQMVAKVVYLENPDTALPYREMVDEQPYVDVGEYEDPLRTAERLGRPMAIVRLGSRVPTMDELNAAYTFSGIPLTIFPQTISEQLSANALKVQNVSFALPEPSHAPTNVSMAASPAMPPRSTHQDGCGNPACGCGPRSEWPGFSCDPPLWSNNLPTLEASRTRPNRDEFLCDGDDRDERIGIRADGTLMGLNREDTVARFDTLNGEKKISVSNRVCVYSPRFAAVRKVSRTFTAQETSRVATYKDKTELSATQGHETSAATRQQLSLQANKNALLAGSFVDQTRGVATESVLVPSGFRQGFEAFENLQLLKLGKHRSSESARLSLGMQAASVWEDAEGLQVAERRIQPIITRDPLRVQEIRSVKSENNSQLRLVKVASKIAAETGEEVEFTLRFDNIGADPIGNVTIIDNLTTRLEYVPDSAECSVEAVFSTERNDGDSLVLQWEITEALRVGEGGLIRFRCRVR